MISGPLSVHAARRNITLTSNRNVYFMVITFAESGEHEPSLRQDFLFLSAEACRRDNHRALYALSSSIPLVAPIQILTRGVHLL